MTNRFILILFIVLGICIEVVAQDAATLFKRANQQYVLFESERDKGESSTEMYVYLLESYNLYVQILDIPNNSAQLVGTKNRLRSIYPYLMSGAAYFSQNKQPVKFLDLATAYIELPQRKAFRGELLQRDNQYPGLLYNAALGYYNLKKYAIAIKYFREFMNIGSADELQMKNCYVYMHLSYNALKDYVLQEQVLEEAVSRFPLSLDFLYNLANVHMATKNMTKLENVIDRVLAIDPNDEQVLPMKARMMEIQHKNREALELYKRLHTLHPDDFVLLKSLARSYYMVGVEIMNGARTITNDAEYAMILQKAGDYFLNARDFFLKILEKEPTSLKFMQGLAEVYHYMDMKAEYEVLKAMVEEGASYRTFPARLLAYNEVHGQQPSNSLGRDFVASDKPLEAAKLEIKIDNFMDSNENNVIDAGESFSVQFTIHNKGQGDAYNLRLRLSEQQGYDAYFDGLRELDGGHLPAGTSKEYTFRYIAKKDLPTALAKINIYAFEQNGFDADPAELEVNTSEYVMPRLRITDYRFEAAGGSAITLGSSGKLKLALQNLGMKTAHNVKLNFTLPANIFETEVPATTIDSIVPGGVVTLDYGFLVNKRFEGDSIAVLVDVNEDTRSSFLREAYKVKLGEYITSTAVTTIVGDAQNRPQILDKDYHLGFESELLKNIPVGKVHPHRYALIIGNEDYSMIGANAEINVPYAVYDADVFREYCIRTFGIPVEQIKTIHNATAGLMHEQLDWLINIASTDPEAEVFFFYSGHGNNDEATKEAFLLPVDITGKNVRLGMALADLYKRLGDLSIKGAYVFLDACFSGSYKSAAPLLSQKGVRVVPNIGRPHGHTMSFSSSSGDQTSSVYHEKKQGYFTYFLIKVLQEAGGQLTMREWFSRTHEEVKRATAKIGKMQEPQAAISPMWRAGSDVQLMVLPN